MNLETATHAFITGGASGIGLALGEAFAARGIAVTLADANPETLARATAGMNGKVRGVLLDVRDRAGWAQAKAEAEAEFGPVDILVNNAGIAPDGRELSDMAPESFDRVIAINLTGVFNGISAFGPALRKLGRGHVVNTASMAGLTAEHPGLGSYSASKFAVVALSEVLRIEMAPYGVGASVLCPGMVATNLPQNTLALGGETRGADGFNPLLEHGMPPGEVARTVLEAIEANQLYVFSHPEAQPRVEARFSAIRDGFDYANSIKAEG